MYYVRIVIDLVAEMIWRPLCEATPICDPLSGYRMRLNIYACVNGEGSFVVAENLQMGYRGIAHLG